MTGIGNKFANLQIYLDAPNEEMDKRGKPNKVKQVAFLVWLLERLSISLEQVRIDFVIRCYLPNRMLTKQYDKIEALSKCRQHQDHEGKKAIIAMGEFAVLEFFGKKPGQVLESFFSETGQRFYASYAPGAALMNPNDAVQISRIIYHAAKYCGLNPKFNPKLAQTWQFELM
jgi:uracil-DNA glycosylase